MAIRYQTPGGKVGTIGGGDPKLKTPLVQTHSESPSKYGGDFVRLSARIDALELLVQGLAKQIKAISVDTKLVTRNHVTSDVTTAEPKRDRSKYMREYRTRKVAGKTSDRGSG